MENRNSAERLLLTCRMSLGDIVMLTAAVRDLHRCYPGRFFTDFKTTCSEVWMGNPHRSVLDPQADGVSSIDCHYPLIQRANEDGRHCLYGFIEFLNDYLGLTIDLSEPRGQVLLTEEEKGWLPQVGEWTGNRPIPYWIVSGGGKFDLTTKWWGTERYQAVVDEFRGRIQFVQIGHAGHWHPPLKGVIDLRGRTNLRQLIRLVYHAQGILCPVTGLMHLAAAVEMPHGEAGSRPCVVVAGGREPVHWEAYPGHRFLDSIGALDCCRETGCWKARTEPLGDLDHRDLPDRLCVDAVEGDPRCMTLVTPERVIESIESYQAEGCIRYLSRSETELGWRAVDRSRNLRFDQRPLTLSRTRFATRAALQECSPSKPVASGDSFGVVICAGGPVHCFRAWLGVHRLRRLKIQCPVEIWSFREEQIEAKYRRALESLGVTFRIAQEVRSKTAVRALPNSAALKMFAARWSAFDRVLVLDADCFPVEDISKLLEEEVWRDCGNLFWAEAGESRFSETIAHCIELENEVRPLVSLAAFVIDRRRCFEALSMAGWLFGNYDFFHKHLDRSGLVHAAFELVGARLGIVPNRIEKVAGGEMLSSADSVSLFEHHWRQRLLPGSDSLTAQDSEAARAFESIWQGGLRPAVEDALIRSRRYPESSNRLWHLVWDVASDDPETRERRRWADAAWDEHYRLAHWVRFAVRLEDLPRVERRVEGNAPYLRDAVAMVLEIAAEGDAIVVTPSESLPTSRLTEMLLEPIRDEGFCYAYGREVVGIRGAATDLQIQKGKPSRESFVLAFTPGWWARHHEEIPDSPLTSIGLDESLRLAMEAIDPKTGPLADLVYHAFRF